LFLCRHSERAPAVFGDPAIEGIAVTRLIPLPGKRSPTEPSKQGYLSLWANGNGHEENFAVKAFDVSEWFNIDEVPIIIDNSMLVSTCFTASTEGAPWCGKKNHRGLGTSSAPWCGEQI
jgi:hypothetical protein